MYFFVFCRLFSSLQPAEACISPVEESDDEERHEIPQEQLQKHALIAFGLGMRQRQLVERRCQLFFLRQLPMPPLSHYSAIVQKSQCGITARYGLERQFIGKVERILCASEVLPAGDGVVVGRRKALEAIAIVACLVVDGINLLEVAVVGHLEVRAGENEYV